MNAGFMLFLFVGVIIVCIGFMVYKIGQFRQRHSHAERQQRMMAAQALATQQQNKASASRPQAQSEPRGN